MPNSSPEDAPLTAEEVERLLAERRARRQRRDGRERASRANDTPRPPSARELRELAPVANALSRIDVNALPPGRGPIPYATTPRWVHLDEWATEAWDDFTADVRHDLAAAGLIADCDEVYPLVGEGWFLGRQTMPNRDIAWRHGNRQQLN